MQNAMTAAPGGARQAAAAEVTREPGPVLFLNPHILLMEAPVTVRFDFNGPSDQSMGMVGGARPMRNPGPEQFNRLWEAFEPSVVFTCRVDQYDPVSKLDNIGVRCRYAVDVMIDQRIEDRGRAIATWLHHHGNPPAMVLEQEVSSLAGATVARFSTQHMLTSAVVDRLLAAWAARAR